MSRELLAQHRQHLSASSLTQFLRCPQQWAYRRLHGLKEPPGSALILGIAHHDTIERNFSQKVLTLKDLPERQVEEDFHEVFEGEVERIGGEGEIRWKIGEKRGRPGLDLLRQQGVSIARLYRKQVAPNVIPFDVEHRFDIEAGGFPLTGRIDTEAELRNGLAPPRWKERETCRECGAPLRGSRVQRGLCSRHAPDYLLEHKTSSRKQIQPDAKIQGSIYQLVRPLPLQFHVAVKTKTPSVFTDDLAPGPASRTRRMISLALDHMEFLIATYGVGCEECLSTHDCSNCGSRAWPGTGKRDSWACNYCGYGPLGTNRCPWWREETWPQPLF